MTSIGDPEQLRMRYVTARYFDVFKMPPLLGRVLDARDDEPGVQSVALSEGAWHRHFGGDRAAIGREIRLGGRPATVVGVMPNAFHVAGGRVDAWAALMLPPEDPGKRLAAHYLGVVARLRPGVSLAQANAEIATIAARAAERFPRENGGLSAVVKSVGGERGEPVRAGLTVVAWAAGAVLLIAWANLGSLQFSRTTARGREFGIRTALGATRPRLMAQLVTESLVVAAIGAAAGLTFGVWLLGALRAFSPETIRTAAGAGRIRILSSSLMASSSRQAVRWRFQSGRPGRLEPVRQDGSIAAATPATAGRVPCGAGSWRYRSRWPSCCWRARRR